MDDNADAKRILLPPPSGRLEKTTGSSPHHMAQHHPTGSETSPSYAPRSSRFGSEPPSVEDDDVWRYATVSCLPETTTYYAISRLAAAEIASNYCVSLSTHLRIQRDHSSDNVKFPDNSITFPWWFPALLPMLSVTHIMPVLVLLSVVGVGMQQCMIRNQNEMHKFSRVQNGCSQQ